MKTKHGHFNRAHSTATRSLARGTMVLEKQNKALGSWWKTAQAQSGPCPWRLARSWPDTSLPRAARLQDPKPLQPPEGRSLYSPPRLRVNAHLTHTSFLRSLGAALTQGHRFKTHGPRKISSKVGGLCLHAHDTELRGLNCRGPWFAIHSHLTGRLSRV